MSETLAYEPHGLLDVVEEHGREWAVCNRCGAQWALHGSNLEQVTQGDGFCEQEGES